MEKIPQKYQKIIAIIIEKGLIQSSEIHNELTRKGEEISLVTVKRALSELAESGLIKPLGSGRSLGYDVSATGRIFADIDEKKYCAIEPDRRYGLNQYNFDLLPNLPQDVFFDDELRILNNATDEYKQRTKDLPEAIQRKELERLIIELSWKSSRIEGNTYTLLDTENLILKNKEAAGHDKKEAAMILNHKNAFTYIHRHSSDFKSLTKRNLEELHAILVKDLSVGRGLRKKPVGVIGSKYRPLDNIHQISEAVESLSGAVSKMRTPYAKALIALAGISYIQPFEDGNKRTARLMANAILLAHKKAPLSYRSVEESEYREAILVFYELNSIVPIKKIFIEQYDFAAKNYAIK